ncbi:hypothetical protein BGX34_005069 [Mortierella sp. NVP85]|nr:hypothetical protein BGX34_005069 [Mortierella sp. NVP85]
MNPLELPEIAELVATYLEGKDLVTCVCVSKTWRDMFLRYRWQVVRVGIPKRFVSSDAPIYIGPHRADIYNHRHWIQDLTILEIFSELDVCQYPNLRCLDIYVCGDKVSYRRISMDPTTMAPSLVDLRLYRVDVPPSFWEALSTHPHIKHLDLSCMHLKEDDTPGFWRTCMNLESLKMNIYFKGGDGFPRNVVFGRMRKLYVIGDDPLRDAYQSDLILQCPMLESLDWFILELPEIEDRFTHRLWPQPKKLHIRGCRIKDKDWAFILNRVGNGLGWIEDLKLGNCELGTQASKALKVHFSTLVRLDVYSAKFSERSIPSDLLCLCPRLEVLNTRDVFVRDVAERGPWICQQLRELRICFNFQDSRHNLHQLVYERLSTLIRLECLIIVHPIADRNFRSEGLIFRLDCGLGRLASLQQLTDFSISTTYYNHSHRPGKEEAVWMVEKWRKLRRIAGISHVDVMSVFESHGIAVK